ncbi:hypothetical protein GF373_05225 [bacterium]|nr:hypothetical protein [bacterium]
MGTHLKRCFFKMLLPIQLLSKLPQYHNGEIIGDLLGNMIHMVLVIQVMHINGDILVQFLYKDNPNDPPQSIANQREFHVEIILVDDPTKPSGHDGSVTYGSGLIPIHQYTSCPW